MGVISFSHLSSQTLSVFWSITSFLLSSPTFLKRQGNISQYARGCESQKPCSPFVFAAPHSRLLVENSKLGSGTEQVEARQSGGANKPREGNRYNLKKKNRQTRAEAAARWLTNNWERCLWKTAGTDERMRFRSKMEMLDESWSFSRRQEKRGM